MSLSRQHPRLEFLEPVPTHRYGFRVNSLRVGPAEVCPHARRDQLVVARTCATRSSNGTTEP